MPTYRVGVVLTAQGSSFQRGFGRARKAVRQTDSALQRASGSATALGRSSDTAGRRARSALERASGSAGGLQSALRRTSNQARRTGDDIQRSARRGERSVRSLIGRYRELGRAIRESGRAGRGAGGGGYGAGAASRVVGMVGGGYALSRAAGQELALDDRFARLAKAGQKSDAEIQQVRRHIESTAGRADIRAPVSEVLAAIEEYVDRTGDLDEAMANLETTAQTIQRTGASGIDIGALSAQLRKGGIHSGDAYRQAMVELVEAGRQGALRPRDFARFAAEPMSLFFAIPGMQGPDAWRDFLTLSQMGMVGTGDPSKTMTAVRAVTAASQDEGKLREMEKLGVYGAAERSPLAVLDELIAATNGNMVKLGRIFDLEARALPAAFTTPEGRDVRRRVSEGVRNADEALFEEETADLANQISAKAQVVRDELQAHFSRLLGGPMEDAAAAAFGAKDYLLGGLGLAVGGWGAHRVGRRGLDVWRRWRSPAEDAAPGGRPTPGRRGRGAPGVGLPGAIHTLHVGTLIAQRTVGGPGGVGAGGRGRGAGGRAARGGSALARAAGWGGGILSKFGGALRRAAGAISRRLPYVGAGIAALTVAGSLASSDRQGAAQQAAGVAGGVGGGAAGAWAGGATGAALGSVVPVLGTAVGGAVGAILGGFAGGWFGSQGGEALAASALERAAGLEPGERQRGRTEARRRWREAQERGDDDVVSEEGVREPADHDRTALERAAGLEPGERQRGRTEARRRWREAQERGDDDVVSEEGAREPADHDRTALERAARIEPGERQRGRTEAQEQQLLTSIQEAVAPARVVNDHRNQSRQSIHVQIGPGAVAVDGTGKGPIEIGEEAADALYERLRERLEGEAQQVSDTVFTDPDPTLSF